MLVSRLELGGSHQSEINITLEQCLLCQEEEAACFSWGTKTVLALTSPERNVFVH